MTYLPKPFKKTDSGANIKNKQEANAAAGAGAGAFSTCTSKAKTHWYLKAPSRHSFYDESYKVVPSLNHAQRVMKLNQITKDNLKIFERLQSVKSDYDANKLLERTQKQTSHKRRIRQHENGRLRKDPLEARHKIQTSLSKYRL